MKRRLLPIGLLAAGLAIALLITARLGGDFVTFFVAVAVGILASVPALLLALAIRNNVRNER